MQLLEMGHTQSLHMWLGIPIIVRLLMDEYDPSGRVFHSPEARSLCCGIIVCCILVTYYRNPARRLTMQDEDPDDNIGKKKPSFLALLLESWSSTINSSSSSMFRNALFISILFVFSWPLNKVATGIVGATDDVCDADDTSCRIANHYGPPICCITPSFCDAKAHNWIYQQGGSAQAYKPDVPISKTVCEQLEESSLRHKVATWPYFRSSKKNPPAVNLKLNMLRCTSEDNNPQEGEEHQQQEGDCCCHPLLPSGSSENATIEIWQTRPDGKYSSVRAGNEDGDCRAKWIAVGNPEDPVFVEKNPSSVEFQTMAPGSTGSLGGLGPGTWEFSPYGPPLIHVLVRPGMDGISPLLVDIPVPIHHQTLEEQPFTWRDWRGPAWVKSKGNPDQPAFNVTSWEADVDNHTVAISVDLYLREDKEFSVSHTAATSKLMCPSLLYGLPSAFFLEPISVCGKYLLDYFDL